MPIGGSSKLISTIHSSLGWSLLGLLLPSIGRAAQRVGAAVDSAGQNNSPRLEASRAVLPGSMGDNLIRYYMGHPFL